MTCLWRRRPKRPTRSGAAAASIHRSRMGHPVGVGEGIRPPGGSTLHAVGPGGATLPVVAMRVGAPSGVGEPLREGGIRG